MEEKSNKSKFVHIFLILAIILIVLIGIFMFKLYKEKTEFNEESIQQNENISDFQNNIDNSTSESNKISTSINTEISTNNISSNTTTPQEKHSTIQHDLSSYIGLWTKPTSNDYLYIHSINNDEITFDFDYNGKSITDYNKATLDGNIASFVINHESNSLTGKITLDNNNILIHIIDSTFENVPKSSITFSNYLGPQN